MPMSESFERRVRAHLESLRDSNLLRQLRGPDGVDLASNDYLGLAAHPLVLERLADAIRVEGCGSTGSRLLRGDRSCFASIERRFAAFKGTDRSLYFSSGYLANLAVLSTLPEAGDVILSDERNHASLIDGIRLSRAERVVFPHADHVALAPLLDRARGAKQIFVVTESLFSMDGDVAPLLQYADMCRSAGAVLIVDEAHAVGLYGARGSGLIEASGVPGDSLVSINTAGKALGVSGAFVAGPEWLVEYLVQKARPFIFSTAPPPALAAAIDASLTLVEEEPWRRAVVAERARALRAALVEGGVAVPSGISQIIPVVLGHNDRAVDAAAILQARGFDVRAIRPPSVAPGTARLRLSVNVTLSEATIDRVVAALAAALGASVPCATASS